MDLNEEHILRYERNIKLPEIGREGQIKLLAGSVLCIGCGGLGSAALYYLTAAGIGRIGIVDADTVELSNLQRQILHRTMDKGRAKVLSAKEKLSELNPDLKIDIYNERLTPENAGHIIGRYDIILDCTDNFPSRFLIGDTCFKLRKPLFTGAVYHFEGQLTTILPGERRPCYRCLFPEMPDEGYMEAYRGAGILGAVAGCIGILQAGEAIKHIIGRGKLLVERLLVFNCLDMAFSELKYKKNENCRLCGKA